MCLTTMTKNPFVAKENFVVYKVLKRLGYDDYITPFQSCLVKLKSELKPDTEFPKTVEIDTERLYANIDKGAIHAYIDYVGCDDDENIFKAIVRKGTRFYISIDGTEIAAESLYITDEEITKYHSCTEEFNETYEYIMSELRETAEQHNGVRIGDILLSDKTFVHAKDYKDDGPVKAIGVVGYFVREKPIVIGLESKRQRWNANTKIEYLINLVGTRKKAYSDYNGQEYTNKLYEAYKNRLNDFPALKYCVEYETVGTKKGNWYFPSSGEVSNIAKKCNSY